MDGNLMVKAIKAIHADCTLKEIGEKLDIAFLKFLSFQLGTAMPFCQENTRLGEQLYDNLPV